LIAQRVRSAWFLTGAVVGFAGLVFADSGTPGKKLTEGGKVSERVMARELGTPPSGDDTPEVQSARFAAVPAAAPTNDTCAGAIPLTLDRSMVATNEAANDDYQTPDDTTCYSGIGNQATKAQGRDVVFSFTAPADGKYTFAYITFNPNDTTGGATFNPVLYLTDCANAGTVNCVRA